MKVAIGCDHGGYRFKEYLKSSLTEWGYECTDCGCEDTSSVDYPDFGIKVAREVSDGSSDRGVLICTTGIGMSIVANKYPGIRAALCHNVDAAEMSRRHNDANVLVLGAKYTEQPLARDITRVWLTTEFEAGRHARRLEIISDIEKTLLKTNNHKDTKTQNI